MNRLLLLKHQCPTSMKARSTLGTHQAFNSDHASQFLSQRIQSARNNNLAARQHLVAAFHKEQFDDVMDPICQTTQSGVENGQTMKTHTTRSTVVSPSFDEPADCRILLGRGGFTKNPGNKAATKFICVSRSAHYKHLQNQEKKKQYVKRVYEALIDKGFTFMVLNQHGSMEPAEESRALEYVRRKLCEGEVTAEERRQKRARCKDNLQKAVRQDMNEAQGVHLAPSVLQRQSAPSSRSAFQRVHFM